ncbi:MAG: nicotinate-nucleotide diphosphorylase (carboxylating) [Omnitrophica WOR_2 bacterium RIFCSPHIGHO2_02_FULL_63_39]|nr:MAG: nicotinate-nucleotide diphosphorylase (carboxylating) [Omnitrophica WOR_2 bacterium GWA2_63_20]OGX31792.1 MAG: nicotinate-nucleotide diphosphorylase (carboxylating) [Omnitrophica WOR_2 bacterium RIFCSPHIGHO2_12_FULL_64_13]OGX35220.1 MAG: nicotinate-nucleotide diphosphorylase (carboxylating) [Omnitrophica WOR_2 bacterium RIFCSPHIGHO2_02_FULL_63_39]OGX48948.1 MAG: nicotinate-nucleotide diphosphorylase (carboxylating) [Omnitrophica WOR_2 bacterium RIFCSPLOWO2_12_FULL_63_16]
MMAASHRLVRLIREALQEDVGRGDLTSRALIPPSQRVRATLIAKQSGIVAGAAFCPKVFRLVDRRIRCTIVRRDGQTVRRGQAILRLEGPARSILGAERTAVNILGHLCGVATFTAQFVRRARPYAVTILDTRKTLPGLRILEKYAVRMGGGQNHRMGLYDAVLIKTNHLRTMQCGIRNAEFGMVIQDAIAKAERIRPRKFVEIEVTHLREFKKALEAKPDAILLDNWNVADIRKAVLLRNSALRTLHSALLLEVSGGVTLRNVRRLAATGVDRISIGALTHSAPSLDVSLQVVIP